MTKATLSPAPSIKQLFTTVGGGILGLPVGFHLAHILLTYVGPLFYGPQTWRQTGGALALIIVPMGAIGGFFAGGLLAGHRPRLYLVTFLPLAILFIGWDVTRSYLSTIDKPRKYLVRMDGPKGAAYRGAVRVGNVTRPLEGTLPDKYECEGLSLVLAIALISPQAEHNVSAKFSVNGESLRNVGEAEKGLVLILQSRGFDEWAGGTSVRGQFLWEDSQVHDILEKQIIPDDPIAK